MSNMRIYPTRVIINELIETDSSLIVPPLAYNVTLICVLAASCTKFCKNVYEVKPVTKFNGMIEPLPICKPVPTLTCLW